MNLEELGRRAVACPRWRWMPGMLTMCNVRVVEGGHDYLIGHRPGATSNGGGWVDQGNASGFFPDLSDPATLGCLLHLVREAWGAWRISLCFSAVTPNTERTWAVPISYPTERDGIKNESFYGRTQGEALVAALESAP